MTQPREALVVEDLHKSFGELEVLKGISITANEHDVVSILGSSGSGNRGRRVLPGSDLPHRVAVQAVGAALARSSARPRRRFLRSASHVPSPMTPRMCASDVGNARTAGMIRPRSRWRGGTAIPGTTPTGRVRRAFGSPRPLPVAGRSAANRRQAGRSRWEAVPALVLSVLLACSWAAVRAAPDPPLPDPLVEAVQRALTERGYDLGSVDGFIGWRTRGAIRKFQRSVELFDTGQIDDATLAALGLGPLAGTKPTAGSDTGRYAPGRTGARAGDAGDAGGPGAVRHARDDAGRGHIRSRGSPRRTGPGQRRSEAELRDTRLASPPDRRPGAGSLQCNRGASGIQARNGDTRRAERRADLRAEGRGADPGP